MTGRTMSEGGMGWEGKERGGPAEESDDDEVRVMSV
jgi:hypothetical protein